MASSSSYRLMMVGVLAIVMFGAGMAYYGYQTAIYPVDVAIGYLARAESAGTPEDLAAYVIEAKRLLPESGNPVWSFPTPRTDFGLIQDALDTIVSRSNSISSVDPHSSEYNTGLTDMRNSLNAIQKDLIEIMPYLYGSFTNIVLGLVWIAVILLIFTLMRKGRAKYREEYDTQ